MSISLTTCRAKITDVHRDALVVEANQVRAGDWVFEGDGDRVKVTGVDQSPQAGWLMIHVEGDPNNAFGIYKDDEITIVPAHGWTQNGNGYRNVPGQSKGDGFKFGEFTETCRCGLVIGSGSDGDPSTASMFLDDHANEANGREIY